MISFLNISSKSKDLDKVQNIYIDYNLLSIDMKMRKPVVDQSKCEGYQICIGIAPEVFELNDKGKSYAKNPQGADETTIQSAIDGCPQQAISWEED